MSRSKQVLPQNYVVVITILLVLITAAFARHVVQRTWERLDLVPAISWKVLIPFTWITVSGLIAAIFARRFVSPVVAIIAGALFGGLAGWPMYSDVGIVSGMLLGLAVALERTTWMLQLGLRMSLVGILGYVGVGWARSYGFERGTFTNGATITLLVAVGALQAVVVLLPIWRQLEISSREVGAWRKTIPGVCVATFWLLFGMAVWALGWHGELKRRVIEIEATGGRVAFERPRSNRWSWTWHIPRAWNVELVDPSPAEISTLRAIPRVSQLALSGTTIDDKLAESVPHWNQVSQLTIRKTQIAGRFLGTASARTTHLILEDSPFSDSSMKWVAQMKQLQTLSLEETNVTAVGLRALTGCARLSQLTLKATSIQDPDMQSLQGLNLEALQLDCPRVTENGLLVLSRLPRLETVSLGNRMSIGTRVVLQLGRISTLTAAHLFFDSLTPEIVEALKTLEQQGMNLYIRTREPDRRRRQILERELKFIDLRFLRG